MKLALGLTIALVGINTLAADFNEYVDISTPITIEQAQEQADLMLKNTKIVKKEFFCVAKIIECRTHYTLADNSGKLLNAFYVRFVSVDRSVGGNGYFFPVKDQPGKYIRFEDFTFDGKLNVDKVVQDNVVKVDKNEDGSVKAIFGSILPRLGTTKYSSVDILIDNKSIVLQGTTFDSADPKFSAPVRIEYLRTEVTY